MLSTGSKLELYQSVLYALDKEKMNPLPGFLHPDLFLTGEFFNGFFVEVDNDSYLIYSKDEKTEDLVKRYSDDIFGLTDQNKEIFADTYLYEAVTQYIADKTGLVFG
jgi:hypothetical protein